jgi:hypothetical protein
MRTISLAASHFYELPVEIPNSNLRTLKVTLLATDASGYRWHPPGRITSWMNGIGGVILTVPGAPLRYITLPP